MQIAAFYVADTRPSKAIEVYDEILEIDAAYWEALRARGDAYLSTTKQTEAIEETEAAEDEELEDVSGAESLSRDETRQALHALLFVSDRPVSADRLAEALGDADRHVVEQLLEELQAEIGEAELPYTLREIAGGYQFTTRPEHAPWIKRMLQIKKRNRLSKAVLETLSIIAYKQPVTRAQVEAIRGVSVSHAFEVLQEKHLIKVSGVAEVPGRPKLYKTTEEFLVHFGLKNLDDLPSIEELQAAE